MHCKKSNGGDKIDVIYIEQIPVMKGGKENMEMITNLKSGDREYIPPSDDPVFQGILNKDKMTYSDDFVKRLTDYVNNPNDPIIKQAYQWLESNPVPQGNTMKEKLEEKKKKDEERNKQFQILSKKLSKENNITENEAITEMRKPNSKLNMKWRRFSKNKWWNKSDNYNYDNQEYKNWHNLFAMKNLEILQRKKQLEKEFKEQFDRQWEQEMLKRGYYQNDRGWWVKDDDDDWWGSMPVLGKVFKWAGLNEPLNKMSRGIIKFGDSVSKFNLKNAIDEAKTTVQSGVEAVNVVKSKKEKAEKIKNRPTSLLGI